MKRLLLVLAMSIAMPVGFMKAQAPATQNQPSLVAWYENSNITDEQIGNFVEKLGNYYDALEENSNTAPDSYFEGVIPAADKVELVKTLSAISDFVQRLNAVNALGEYIEKSAQQ